MNFKERITYSKDEMIYSLNMALENMSAFRFDPQYRQYLGNDFIEKFFIYETDIKKRKDDPFTIVVVGNFKRGKSTLINAILQEDVVTANVTPETVTINRISYGLPENEIILSGNRKMKLVNDELRREKLENIISNLGEPIRQLNIYRPNNFLKKVTIIDTPGIDDAMQDYSEIVKNNLLQADAIIYVFNVLYPISQTEQFFLRSAILPQKFTKLFMLGNYTDKAETIASAERIKNLIHSRLIGLFPNQKIYMVSALDELFRVLQIKRPNEDMADMLANEFQILRQDLQKLVEEKSESVVLDRMQRLTSAMLLELNEELDSIEKGLGMGKEDVKTALNKIQEEREEGILLQKKLQEHMMLQINSMRDETKLWMGEFLQRIIDETSNLNNESDIDLRKYYEFYFIDLLNKAMNICLEYHKDQLYYILDNISTSLMEKFVIKSKHNNYQFRFKLDNRIWTKGDTVGLFVSFLSGTSFLSTMGSLIADGITGYLREKEIDNRKPELINQISLKLSTMYISINQMVEKIYCDLSNNLEKLIIEYFQEKLKSNEHLLKQAINISEKNLEIKKQIAATLENARKILQFTESQSFTMPIANISGFQE